MEENATSPTLVTVEENRMKKHVNIAAILQIVFGSILALAALIIALAFGFVDQFVDDPTALKVLAIVGTPLVIMFLLFGGAMIAGGVGLLSLQAMGQDPDPYNGCHGAVERTVRYPQGCLYYLGACSVRDRIPL